ncbi:HNH endonuclease [Bacillus sp. CMF12]|uniref:HNH endonuclease n=1 Tax=Bacillus sp. CMF12 TaxID=2884834 RepID=UPI002079547C|nr:HNH endonuclease [Bacillus sp. CMF12]USK48880.1 HNH endonuclease [Bacillus sp. CMF12]
MISIEKTEKPAILKDKEETWKDELMEYIEKNEEIPKTVIGRYNHKEIKEALLKETNNKCAYCESKILHIDYGDIEHIEPKSMFREKTFDWNNLTIACGKCNQSKGSYHSLTNPLLNPYVDQVENEIVFAGPFPYSTSNKSEVTIKKLKLDRVDLIEKRKEALDKLQPFIYKYQITKDEELRQMFLEDILGYVQKDKEYSSMLNQNLKLFNLL